MNSIFWGWGSRFRIGVRRSGAGAGGCSAGARCSEAGVRGFCNVFEALGLPHKVPGFLGPTESHGNRMFREGGPTYPIKFQNKHPAEEPYEAGFRGFRIGVRGFGAGVRLGFEVWG